MLAKNNILKYFKIQKYSKFKIINQIKLFSLANMPNKLKIITLVNELL